VNNIKNQFNIEKARNGGVVEIFNHVFGDWGLIGEVHWVGTDLNGNVYYQYPNDIVVKNINVKQLRMKQKTDLWWFRTYVIDGHPIVLAEKDITGFAGYESFFAEDEYWIEEAWSKEIPII
jgi:hypothetical protein